MYNGKVKKFLYFILSLIFLSCQNGESRDITGTVDNVISSRFTIEKDALSFGATGGRQFVRVVVDNRTEWTVAAPVDWCNVRRYGGKISVLCDMNYSGEDREALITVCASMDGVTELFYIKVIQSYDDTVWDAILQIDDVKFNAPGGEKKIVLDLPDGAVLKIKSGKKWVQARAENDVVMIKADLNNTGAERSAKLQLICSFKGNKYDSEIVVIQNTDAVDWKLIWEDDFNSPCLDETKWTKTPRGTSAWDRLMTNNAECYTFRNGTLTMWGLDNRNGEIDLNDNSPFLTGGIVSENTFLFTYGKVEIRARMDSGQGAWPAFWMLGKDGKWPDNGEIDIMEHLNNDKFCHHTVHTRYTKNAEYAGKPVIPGNHTTSSLVPGEYNIFGIEWYPGRIVWTLNGEIKFSYNKIDPVPAGQWPFDQPFYLLLDMQLGGLDWVGDIDASALPLGVEIDWVRVYQLKK